MQQLTIETVMAIWNAAVEACATVAENCEPDDHGYLSVQEIAETIERECSVFVEDFVK